jgi:5'-methylthioadenosine phosphorylase
MIGIIGGTGIYELGLVEDGKFVSVKTPYGSPSDKIMVGFYKGKKLALLPRHGAKHTIPPHKVNNQANIYALKKLGAGRIISTAAVGSLKTEYKPKDIVFPDQFIDLGKDIVTYYHGPDVYHVSPADPVCPDLNKILAQTAKKLGIRYHDKGIYLRVAGPRFSTRAESRMFRNFADIIGMTAVPEIILAREQAICYANIAAVTDYDVWAERPVNAQEVKRTMKANAVNIEKILKAVLPKVPEKRSCECKNALLGAKL